MKRLLLVWLMVGATALAFANAKEDSTKRIQNAADVLNAIMAAPDKGIPNEVFDGAECIVVVPHMIKGGLGFGGLHGRGVATCRTKAGGWSAPAFISIGGGNWGLQIGLQGVDLVMMVMNDNGLQQLLSNKFQIGANASAAAGPVGRHASADTDWKADSAILAYSRAKGLFAGITLDGNVVQQDDDSTVAMYGRKIPQKQILDGQVGQPGFGSPFISAVQKYAAKAKASK